MTVHQIARSIATAISRRAGRALAGNAMSATRRYAVLDAYVARHNEGTVTAGQYLTEILGVDRETAAPLWGPLGKAIKKAYVALHGEDPAKIRLTTEHKRLHRAIGYLIGEPALAIGTSTYPRTAALIGA